MELPAAELSDDDPALHWFEDHLTFAVANRRYAVVVDPIACGDVYVSTAGMKAVRLVGGAALEAVMLRVLHSPARY